MRNQGGTSMFEKHPDAAPTLTLITTVLAVVVVAAIALGLVPAQ